MDKGRARRIKNKALTPIPSHTDSLQLFFSAATHYYVAGRYAVLAGLVPVAGNLLHHAIEMYVKGGVSKTMSLPQLKGLSHNLPNVWAAFKAKLRIQP